MCTGGAEARGTLWSNIYQGVLPNPMKIFASIFLSAGLVLSSCSTGSGDTTIPESIEPKDVATRVAASGLAHPWELVWGPDNWIWFTERKGPIGRLNPETGEVERLFTVPDVWQRSESGLLGLALHPQFATTPYLYVAYTYNNGSAKERIVRYTYTGSGLTDPTVLLDGILAWETHDGCRLSIVGDKLFATTGDAQQTQLSQNTKSLNGKVLRMNLDGSIPSDNPDPTSYTWSFGHRNAQGLVMAPNGIFYSSEHGPGSDDEVNIIEKGRNYGWPAVKGYCNIAVEQQFCDANNVVEPIAAWTPTVAASGMTYYDKDLIPQWKNSLLMLTLKDKKLIQLKLDAAGRKVDSQYVYFKNEYGRLRGICVAPDGRLFFSTNDEGDDKVIEVKPKDE